MEGLKIWGQSVYKSAFEGILLLIQSKLGVGGQMPSLSPSFRRPLVKVDLQSLTYLLGTQKQQSDLCYFDPIFLCSEESLWPKLPNFIWKSKKRGYFLIGMNKVNTNPHKYQKYEYHMWHSAICRFLNITNWFFWSLQNNECHLSIILSCFNSLFFFNFQPPLLLNFLIRAVMYKKQLANFW